MGKIKSAWEIALEKIESIQVDEAKIRHNANIDAIRRIAGSYLLSDDDSEEKTKESLKSYSKDEIKEALGQTIINSLSLPQAENTDEKKPLRLSFLLSLALPGNEEVQDFLQHRNQMMEQLKSQFEPMLRDKEEKIRAQYGEAPHLTFENDKECREMANKYLERLQDQYQKTLDDAKEQLREVFK